MVIVEYLSLARRLVIVVLCMLRVFALMSNRMLREDSNCIAPL